MHLEDCQGGAIYETRNQFTSLLRYCYICPCKKEVSTQNQQIEHISRDKQNGLCAFVLRVNKLKFKI